MEYQVGDVVTTAIGGTVEHFTVTHREADVKNGRPGWVAKAQAAWGYDSQIVGVNVPRPGDAVEAVVPEGSGYRMFNGKAGIVKDVFHVRGHGLKVNIQYPDYPYGFQTFLTAVVPAGVTE